MYEVLVGDKKFDLLGEIIKPGNILSFKAVDRDGNTVDISKIRGKKIISSFPKLHTDVCDLQAKEIVKYAEVFLHIKFISITMDDSNTVHKWMKHHKHSEKMMMLSDKEMQQFALATNAYIPKLERLARGFIVLDDNNVILEMSFKQNVGDWPDWEFVKKHLI